MNCGIEERIALYAGGDLPVDEAAEVERHLTECPACSELAAELAALRGGLADLGAAPAPNEALSQVRDSVLARVATQRSWRRWAAAAAAVLVAIALGALLRFEQPEPPSITLAQVGPMLARPTAPPVKKYPRPAAVERKTVARTAEPMTVKLLTEDPDVVIYWIVEEAGD